ncbi:MAG: hypothetical protein RIR86_3265, partial [Acidobacteriota bacterium]
MNGRNLMVCRWALLAIIMVRPLAPGGVVSGGTVPPPRQ